MQYLLLIYNDDTKLEAATQAEQQSFGKDYQDFNAWLAKEGSLLGTATWPSGITTVRVQAGKTLTTDGPFTETREGVGGFCLIEATDLDAAIKIASRVPSARYGAVEIRPVDNSASK